jgi:hypothetical protein
MEVADRIMPGRACHAMLPLLVAACSAAAGPGTADALARYRRAFEQAAGDHIVAAQPRAAVGALARQHAVVWLGDHHYSERLHELQRDVLTSLHTGDRPLLLLLEAIGEQDESIVADYLAGAVDEARLRLVMRRRWAGSWLDDESLDAPHYRAMLRFARERRVPVHALEPTPRLRFADRDGHIAATVRRLAAAHPDHRLVVVLGQAHLLGDGDVVGRTGLGGLVVGGLPPAALCAAAPAPPRAGMLLCSDGGVWWFGELLAGA